MFSATERLGARLEFLEDEGNSQRRGLARMGQVDRLAVDADLAVVGRQDASQQVNEGALAGAVFADQGMDFTAPQLDVNPIQGPDAGKTLGETADF